MGAEDPESLVAEAFDRSGGDREVSKDRVIALLGESLAADDHLRTRALLSAYHARVGRPADEVEITDDMLERAGRVQRAQMAIGIAGAADWTEGVPVATQKRLDQMLSPRHSGDALERAAFRPGSYRPLEEFPIAQSANEVLAQARAMARTPHRFREAQCFPDGTLVPIKHVALVVPTTPEGLRDFLRHARASGHFSDLMLAEEYSPAGDRNAYSLRVAMAASLPGGDVVLSARAEFGADRHPIPLERAAAAAGLEDLVSAATRQPGGSELPTGTSQLFIRDLQGPVAGARSVRDVSRLLGEDRCRHENASWRAIAGVRRDEGSPEVPDTGRLSCPDCLRTMLASEPLHRFPVGHPLLGDLPEEDYLASERFYAELRGDRRPITSISQLRERDGLATLDPGAYPAGEERRSAPRVSSIASAMNRR